MVFRLDYPHPITMNRFCLARTDNAVMKADLYVASGQKDFWNIPLNLTPDCRVIACQASLAGEIPVL